MNVRLSQAARGFSLMEVVTALSVISFALVALLGMFPVGLDYSRHCVAETRAAQLTRMVVSTLASEPFIAVRCFGPDLPSLNLNTLDTPKDAETKVVLYVSYDAQENPQIVRAEEMPASAIYRIEMRFHPETFPNSTPPRVIGNTVRLRMTALNAKQAPIFETSTLIGRFQRVPLAK